MSLINTTRGFFEWPPHAVHWFGRRGYRHTEILRGMQWGGDRGLYTAPVFGPRKWIFRVGGKSLLSAA